MCNANILLRGFLEKQDLHFAIDDPIADPLKWLLYAVYGERDHTCHSQG